MKYEGYKILKNKLLLIGIILSCALTIYYSSLDRKSVQYENDSLYEYDRFSEKYSEELYNELQAKHELTAVRYELTRERRNRPVTEEMYEQAGFTKEQVENFTEEEKQEIFDEFEYYLKLSGRANTCYNSIEYRDRVLKNARRLQNMSNRYQSRVNKKLLQMYAGDIDYVVSNEWISQEAAGRFDSAEYADYVNIVLILMVVCIEFLIEHRNHTYQMIYSSAGGRGKTYRRKVAVVVAFTVFLSIVTTLLMNLLVWTDERGAEVLKMDIQNIYKYSPYRLKFGQLIFMIGLLRTLGYLVLALFFVMIVTMFHKSIVPFIVGIGAGCGGYAVFDKLMTKMRMMEMNNRSIRGLFKRYTFIRKYTPFALIRDGISYLRKYEPNNVMNYPVTTVTIAVVVNILYLVLFFVAGYEIYLKRFRKRGV